MTRIPDFYDRVFNVATTEDSLTCRECGNIQTFDHDELPDVRVLLTCPVCELPSRVPALRSQAGMPQAPDPPSHDDRS